MTENKGGILKHEIMEIQDEINMLQNRKEQLEYFGLFNGGTSVYDEIQMIDCQISHLNVKLFELYAMSG